VPVDEDNIFTIHSCEHAGKIEFSGLETGRNGVVEGFSVRFTDENLTAGAHVYAAYSRCLTDYFEDLARHWSGWDGPKEWSSFENGLILSSTNDGLGHIALRVRLRGGSYPRDWEVAGTILTEGGLLDRIASDCERFAGRVW
jgi:hypothetical protein